MRRDLICLFAAIMITYSVSSQEVVLEKIENGHRVEIFAVNNTNVDQEVTLDLTLVEVSVDKDLPVMMIVPAEARVKMATLTPEPLKAWSYKTRYKYEEHVIEPPPPPVTSRSSAGQEGQEIVHPPNTPPSVDPPAQQPFESGPDFGESEEVQEVPEQLEDNPVNEPPRSQTTKVPPGTSVTGQSRTDDEGPMGPPLSTDDRPIPARYYEVPEKSEVSNPLEIDDANLFEIPPSSVLTLAQPDKVTVYGQPGCPRCKMAKDYFEENSIAFEYFDITADKVAYDQMTSRLFESGFEGGQFIMPVIYVDDNAHYSIKDLEGFLEGVATRE